MVHWPLMGGLLHLLQWGGAWAGCGPAKSPPRCTKFCSPPRPLLAVPNVTAHPSTASEPITLFLYNGPLLCSLNVPIKGLAISWSWRVVPQLRSVRRHQMRCHPETSSGSRYDTCPCIRRAKTTAGVRHLTSATACNRALSWTWMLPAWSPHGVERAASVIAAEHVNVWRRPVRVILIQRQRSVLTTLVGISCQRRRIRPNCSSLGDWR